MTLNAMEYKIEGNEYYKKKQWLSAIDSYNKAIQMIENNVEQDPPLYLLYLNRSAAYIKDKNFYSGYEDAKKSLKLNRNDNFKGFYRAAVCSYHLGFIEKCNVFIKEGTKDHQENLLDYLNLKLSIEKKVNIMNKYRKTISTAKKSINSLEQILDK